MALTAFKLMVSNNVSGLAVVNAAGELVDTISVRDLRGMGATAENWTNLWSSVVGQSRESKQRRGRKADRHRCARCDLFFELSPSTFCACSLPAPELFRAQSLRRFAARSSLSRLRPLRSSCRRRTRSRRSSSAWTTVTSTESSSSVDQFPKDARAAEICWGGSWGQCSQSATGRGGGWTLSRPLRSVSPA